MVVCNVCGVFEDWIYMFFKEYEGLCKFGNIKLFGLFCKICGLFIDLLVNVFVDGFGFKLDWDLVMGDW